MTLHAEEAWTLGGDGSELRILAWGLRRDRAGNDWRRHGGLEWLGCLAMSGSARGTFSVLLQWGDEAEGGVQFRWRFFPSFFFVRAASFWSAVDGRVWPQEVALTWMQFNEKARVWTTLRCDSA